MTTWLRVTLPYATFILGTDDGKVTTAPGAEWAQGRSTRDVAAYFRRRGGSVEPLDDAGVFIDVASRAYDGETAARLIEERCRSPYKPPLRIDVGHAKAAARREAAGVAWGATGQQGGAA